MQSQKVKGAAYLILILPDKYFNEYKGGYIGGVNIPAESTQRESPGRHGSRAAHWIKIIDLPLRSRPRRPSPRFPSIADPHHDPPLHSRPPPRRAVPLASVVRQASPVRLLFPVLSPLTKSPVSTLRECRLLVWLCCELGTTHLHTLRILWEHLPTPGKTMVCFLHPG